MKRYGSPCTKARVFALLTAVLVWCLFSAVAALDQPNPLVQAGKGLKDGATIAHGAIAQLGYEAKIDVSYVPDEGKGLVHMKDDPGEVDEKRHILLQTTVQFLYDWENSLPGAEVRKLIGFGLPQPGPVKTKMPVRWEFSKNLIEYTELHADDWEGMLPTWWNYTDESGVATAHLYLKADQPLGGVRKVEEGEVRVMAKVQNKLPLGPAALGLGLGEEIFRPTTATATIRIERHIPTEWEGEITIHRTVSGIARANYRSQDGRWTERVFEGNMWDGTLEITDIHLDTTGAGSGNYTFSVQGSCNRQVDTTVRSECNDRPRTLTDRRNIDKEGSGKEHGVVPVRLLVDPRGPSYAVIPSVISTGMALQLGFSGRGTEQHKWTDCDGNHSMDNELWDVYPNSTVIRAFQLAYQVPADQWPDFDPDAPSLSGFTQWNSTIKSTNGTTTYTVTTTMKWNLRRIYK